jgi:hypothetical protein
VLVTEVTDEQAVVWGWNAVSPAGAATSEALALACEEAVSGATLMANDLAGRVLVPDQMIVGLPGSQVLGQAWPIVQRRSRPDRPVEERELTGLLGRALRLSANRFSDRPGARLIDAAVASLAIDGRGVTDPVGFKGHEMSAAVFAAMAGAKRIDAWCEAARRLEFSALTLTAAPLALSAAVAEPQAVLLDVGGTVTELTLCRAGCPLALQSLPVGGMEVTRALVQRWGLAPERAERVKRLYADDRLPSEAGPQVRETLMPVLRDWLVAVEATLAHLMPDEPLPRQLVLAGGGSALREVAEAVATLAWSERLQFERHPEVAHLRPGDVPGVVNRTDCGRGADDVTALALAAWAARQTRPQSRPARLLGDLCRGEAIA